MWQRYLVLIKGGFESKTTKSLLQSSFESPTEMKSSSMATLLKDTQQDFNDLKNKIWSLFSSTLGERKRVITGELFYVKRTKYNPEDRQCMDAINVTHCCLGAKSRN